MSFKFLMCIVLSFIVVQQNIGQTPTPTPQKVNWSEQKKEEYLTKVNVLIETGGNKFKEQTPQSIKLSIEDFEEAVKLLDLEKENLGLDGKGIKSIVLFSLGTAYNQLGEPKKSIQILESSLPLYQEIRLDDEFPALTYKILADNYKKLDEHQKASENYARAIQEFRNLLGKKTNSTEINQSKSELAGLFIMAIDSFLMTGAKNTALELSTEATQIFSELNKPVEKVNALNRIGRINLEIGKTNEAIINFNEALTLIRSDEVQKNPDETVRQLEGVGLSNLGHSYNLIGEKTKAHEYFQASLKLADKYNLKELKPIVLNNLGIYQMESGNFTEAIKIFSESANISESLGELRTQSIAFNNIGASYLQLGNFTKADEFWSKAIELSVKINDVETTANLLANITGALLELGETKKALEMIETAKKYYEITGNRPNLSAVYILIARIYKKENENAKAIENAEKSLEMAQEVKNKRLETGVQMFLATIYREQRNFPKATRFYLASLQSAQQINEIVVEATSLLGLSQIQSELKNPSLAILYGKKAVNQFQNIRYNIKSLDQETQQIFVENIRQAYQHLADLLITQGRIAEAEQVLALLKEEELYEYVRRDDKVAKELTAKLSLTEEETAVFKRYNEFAEHIASIGKEFTELEAEKRKLAPNQIFDKQLKLDELSKKLKDATEVFLKFLDELKVEFGEENARIAQVDSGLQALLKEMNATETVIISTIASPTRLNLILTTTSFQKAYTVDVAAGDLNKLVADFRRAVQNPGVDPRPIGNKLYNILLKPLAKDLADSGVKTIVWSLDGALRYVPLSALWDGKKYLAESYANAVITLASRDKLKDLPGDKTTWKTLGFGVSKSATIEELEAGATVKRRFDALSSVPEELCRVIADEESVQKCAAKGIINGRRFLDEQFTLQEFKNQLGKFPLVHIASHFSLKAGNDRNSYLLLGGGDERRLTIAELNRSNPMFIGVELLTLSACNTAMTGEKKSNGVEIEGFGAIAQKQGAKSVLATLWAVADPSTRDLMNEFYTFLSRQKLSKAESLRQAQIKLIYGTYNYEEILKLRSDLAGEIPPDASQIPFQKDEKRPFAHPFYWSPFILIGNWQ